MFGGRKISVKTYREISGTLLGTEHASCEVYQIEDSLFSQLSYTTYYPLKLKKKPSELQKWHRCCLHLSPGQLNSAVQHQISVKELPMDGHLGGTLALERNSWPWSRVKALAFPAWQCTHTNTLFFFVFQSNTGLTENLQSEHCCPPFLPLWCHACLLSLTLLSATSL